MYRTLKAGQTVNMKQLAQDALDNWDKAEMSASAIAYLEYQAEHGDEAFEISPETARSFSNEWDMLSEYATSAEQP